MPDEELAAVPLDRLLLAVASCPELAIRLTVDGQAYE
jgi:hypothetical protein